ncbi:unnamed protein product [Clonostachys solani]|uniref:Capsule polysaccharide biosynthesis protein n=1 Tax=Clonostachys solani TaxID=160281 RepID=A0A9P0EMV9_9HYPO|nr:unnamed protein product [Clonostachys solani]
MAFPQKDLAVLLDLKIRPLSHNDNRSDEDIIHSILNPPPVTAEENVWAFWDKGYNAMPPWQKRNVLGWARNLGPGWVVRVLDLVHESPANIFNFLDGENLPRHLNTGRTTGRYAGANTSDTIRLPCVYQHGGVWMDVGIMLLMHLDQVCWGALKDPKSKFQVAVASADPTMKSGVAENFFIAGRKGNGFIKRWMMILLEAWSGRMNNKGIHAHPLFHHLVRDGNITHVFQGSNGDKLDYFQGYLAYERLRLLEDPHDGFSGPSYCKNRVLLIDYREFAAGAMLTNDSGPRQLQLFRTRYDQDRNSKEFQEAKKFFAHLLSNAAMLKQYHWRDHDVPTLADLWDKPEYHEYDAMPHTFGSYLRHISSNYTQDRTVVGLKFPPVREKVLVAGVLETFDD